MNLHDLVSELIINTKGGAGGLFSLPSSTSSLGLFVPELVLCATMLVLLLLRIIKYTEKVDPFLIMLLGTGLAFLTTAPWRLLALSAADPSAPAVFPREIFTGMLVYDPLTIFMRSVLIGFTFVFTVFTKLSGIPDKEDGPDIYTLILGSTLGMCLMASANHLLMVFMAVEMASVPSYALAGMLKGRKLSSEAALKYSVYGAGAAGVMLYGISLITGLLNTAHLPTLAVKLAEAIPGMAAEEYMVLALGGLMIMVGLAFKLSAVPFHFWCPDVFEGAPAEVNAFLSVASKAAALALLIRVAIGFGALPPERAEPGRSVELAAKQVVSEPQVAGLFAVPVQEEPAAAQEGQEEPAPSEGEAAANEAEAPSEEEHGEEGHAEEGHEEGHGEEGHGHDADAAHGEPASTAGTLAGLAPARDFIGKLIAFFAVITCTFGNLAAYGQTNIKRLLAYSTIAHAGYMMMPIPAVMVMCSYNTSNAEAAVGSLAIYIVVYLFMNLGAFAIVAFLRNAMQSEEIKDYAGLVRRCPITAICFVLILFSLVGLPPLAGFIGKFAIFAALADGYRISATAGAPQTYLMVLLLAGGVNTAISLFYYLRVVRVMTIDEEAEDRAPFSYSEVSLETLFVVALTLPTALLIFNWNLLNEWALAAARQLLA